MVSRVAQLHIQILSVAFAAGAVGGLINFLIAPLFGALHITTALGVDIAPGLNKGDLYQKLVWGGVFGFLFLIPLRKYVKQWWVRACIFGVVPSLVQMFLVFPLSTPFKVGGVGLGALTPVFVLLFNTIGWGIPAYAWFRLAGYEDVEHMRAHRGGLDGEALLE
ncbi:g10244 [Coccomyxa viridis]|uniref:G10244 protein n=1 Tax=Coccomyxa viridis TaxID=1274662 RepID=A0ABP1G5A2_9CHLO